MSNENAFESAKILIASTKETILPHNSVEGRALHIMLTDEAGFYGYTWEQCLAMAQSERDRKDEK